MDITERQPLIYTAHSKLSFFCRDAICEYVLMHGGVPLNPFRMFEYFLGDRVDRDLVRRANNTVVQVADEVWVFGTEIANGVLFEIDLAREHGKAVKFFTLGARVSEINPATIDELSFEQELISDYGGDEKLLLAKLGFTVS
jgi:hypothetical protein